MMKPITKFASNVVTTERVADMCSMAFREAMAGAPGPSFLEIGRDILDAHVPLESAVIPASRAATAPRRRASATPTTSTASPRSSSTPSARACCSAARSGRRAATRRRSSSSATLNIPAYMNGAARGTLPPGDPHHFHLTRRHAFNNADVILIVGTPFDFRMGYGKRLQQGGDGHPDRHGLPDGRQEPRHRRSASSATRARSSAEVAKAAKGRSRRRRASASPGSRRCATRRSA